MRKYTIQSNITCVSSYKIKHSYRLTNYLPSKLWRHQQVVEYKPVYDEYMLKFRTHFIARTNIVLSFCRIFRSIQFIPKTHHQLPYHQVGIYKRKFIAIMLIYQHSWSYIWAYYTDKVTYYYATLFAIYAVSVGLNSYVCHRFNLNRFDTVSKWP